MNKKITIGGKEIPMPCESENFDLVKEVKKALTENDERNEKEFWATYTIETKERWLLFRYHELQRCIDSKLNYYKIKSLEVRKDIINDLKKQCKDIEKELSKLNCTILKGGNGICFVLERNG